MCTTLNYKSEIPNNRILYSISLIISYKHFSESQQIAVVLLINQQMVFLTHILNLPQFFHLKWIALSHCYHLFPSFGKTIFS